MVGWPGDIMRETATQSRERTQDPPKGLRGQGSSEGKGPSRGCRFRQLLLPAVPDVSRGTEDGAQFATIVTGG